MITISNYGEFSFIRHIASKFSVPKGYLGIGDDCALIPGHGEEAQIITTDALVEGVHFLLDKISPHDLGVKSLATNLSDVAAMGGSPTSFLLTLCLPKTMTIDWLDHFLEGLKSFNLPLIGGDTTLSNLGLVISITVLGTIKKRETKLRKGAKSGDIVVVSDYLGDSSLGLKLLLEGKSSPLIARHCLPRPHLQEGQFLASKPNVHAMIDISDGIASDMMRIAEQSSCGFSIALEKIPLSPLLQDSCKELNLDPYPFALGGGEDYCLLATIDSHSFPSIAKEFQDQFHRPLYPIGTVTSTLETIEYTRNNQKLNLSFHGFDHFKSPT